MKPKKTYGGLVILQHDNGKNEIVFCQIRNCKIIFYSQEKMKLFDKIKSLIDEQFMSDSPDQAIIKQLSKKLQILLNCYDGVIQLDSSNYRYQCYV